MSVRCILLCNLRLLFFSSFVFFFKQKTAYEMRISDWSSDVCSSDLDPPLRRHDGAVHRVAEVADQVAADRVGEVVADIEHGDRKSVVSGTSVSVRVDLGGRRIIKKKNESEKTYFR